MRCQGRIARESGWEESPGPARREAGWRPLRLALPLSLILWAALCFRPVSLPAQGTLEYDQVCGLDGLVVEGLDGIGTALGQSFIPALSGITFVQLQAVVYPVAGSATSRIYLREGGPAGPLLGASELLLITDNTLAVRTWFFPETIALAPGRTYYLGLEAAPANPATLGMSVSYLYGWPYSQGTLYANGAPSANADLWFRTGVVVPEPGAGVLLALALGGWAGWRGIRSRRQS